MQEKIQQHWQDYVREVIDECDDLRDVEQMTPEVWEKYERLSESIAKRTLFLAQMQSYLDGKLLELSERVPGVPALVFKNTFTYDVYLPGESAHELASFGKVACIMRTLKPHHVTVLTIREYGNPLLHLTFVKNEEGAVTITSVTTTFAFSLLPPVQQEQYRRDFQQALGTL